MSECNHLLMLTECEKLHVQAAGSASVLLSLSSSVEPWVVGVSGVQEVVREGCSSIFPSGTHYHPCGKVQLWEEDCGWFLAETAALQFLVLLLPSDLSSVTLHFLWL